jgi:glycosyltransferase involved in cell wall biosynthesis
MRLVSVIIPVFNPTEHLVACVESVLQQAYSNFEVILVDDGSSNRALEAMTSTWPSSIVQVYRLDRNKGVAHARNWGVQHARGDYLCFIDQDDLWPPHKLRLQAKYLDEHTAIDFVIGQQVYFLSAEQTHAPPWLRQDLLHASLPGYLPGTVMVRKSSFAKIGFFDEHLVSGTDDVDWFFRAKDQGFKSTALTDDLLYKRVHGNNLSQQVAQHHRELLRVVAASIARQKIKST